MKLEILFKTLRRRRRSLIALTVSLVALLAMYVALYPTLLDQGTELDRMLDSYPDAFRAFFNISDFASPEGYLNAELFSFMMPLILLLFGIGGATDATAGEEERKTIDLILAMPIRRRSFVLQKFAAIAIGLGVIGGAAFVFVAVFGPLFEVDVPTSALGAAVLFQTLAAIGFAAVGLLVGCVTGRRGVSRGIAAGVALGMFLIDSFARLNDTFEPWRVVSPIYHAVGMDPLRTGFGVDHFVFLVVFAAVFIVAAPFVFERRDLAT